MPWPCPKPCPTIVNEPLVGTVNVSLTASAPAGEASRGTATTAGTAAARARTSFMVGVPDVYDECGGCGWCDEPRYPANYESWAFRESVKELHSRSYRNVISSAQTGRWCSRRAASATDPLIDG